MINNAHCMTCRIDTGPENRLKNIRQLLYDIDDYNGKIPNFNWFINPRCQYGIQCNKIDNMARNMNRLTTEIEPKLVTVAYSDDTYLYHNILNLLRGYFPAVYKQVELLHHKGKID